MYVFLSADSFVSLVAAVAEGFKNEVGGILLGDRFLSVDKVNKMLIKQVMPLQTAKRGYSSVEYHTERTYRVLDMWYRLTPHWPLGWFHSHPTYGKKNFPPEPSDDDIEFMEHVMDQSEIMLIVSIKEAKRRDELGYIKDGKRISGAVGKYHIEIAGWNLDEDEVEEVDVWCPHIDIINLGHKAGTVSRVGGLFDHDTEVSIMDMRKIARLVQKYENYLFRHLDDWGSGPIRKDIMKILKRIRKENT